MHLRQRRAQPYPSDRRAPRAALLLALAAWATAAAASGQDRLSPAEWKRDYHGLALLCRSAGLQIAPTIASWSQVPPGQSMVVILGAPYILPVELASYLDKGGAVLVARDEANARATHRPRPARLPWTYYPMEWFERPKYGIQLRAGPHRAARESDSLDGFTDCPLVTRLDHDHPITRSVDVIATNRPAALDLAGWWGVLGHLAWHWRPVAWLPPLEAGDSGGPPLIAVRQSRSGGRAVALADPSVLSNQMLLRGDNALLARQMIEWLAEPSRTDVLFLRESGVYDPPDPRQVDIQLPIPSPEQLAEILSQIPPGALLEIGNAVARSAEDQQLLNQGARLIFQRMGPADLRRMLVTAATALVCLVGLTGLVGSMRAERSGKEERTAELLGRRDLLRWERQQAAKRLWTNMKAEWAVGADAPRDEGIGTVPWAGRPLRSWLARRQAARWERRMANAPARYWTPGRLRQLERQVRRWRRLHATGVVIIRPDRNEDTRE